ncbi:MAG: protein kinase domain-containing protein [Gemmatimonadales bacterium]
MTASARLTAALTDRYRLERELGQGGMATVYLAQDLRHHRRVAVKVLRPELAAVIGGDRFLAEIKTTANLQHPHILPLFDSGEADGFVFYVMPYVEGESLRDRIRREHQLPVDDAVRTAREVADALDYAHRHGVIHRDIKPENILLHDGRVLVADFGIALAVSRSEGGTRITETGMSLGTPHYMAPEQAMGERELSPRADIYALGCVTYEMLCGEPPFTGPTAQAIIARVMTEEPRSLTLQRKTIPPHLEAVTRKALEKLPADRFATAAEFSAALMNPALTLPAGVPAGRPFGRARSLWNPLSIGAAALAAGLALLAAALASPAKPAPVARFRVMLDSTRRLFFTGQANPPRIAVSPDGTELVYVGVSESTGVVGIGNLGSSILGSGTSGFSIASRSNALIHHRFSATESRQLPGTEGAWAPQFAPDGERVAYVVNLAGGGLAVRIVSLSGGPPVTVLDSAVGSAVAWGPDDHLYFLHPTEPEVYRVPAAGGAAERVTRLQGPAEAAFEWPAILPNGKGIIVTTAPRQATNASPGDRVSVQVFDLATGAPRGAVTGALGRYARTGHLVYATADGALLAAPFDQGSLAFTGRPVTLLQGIDVRFQGITDVALSPAGTLAYTTRSFNAPETVSWVGRDGSAARVDPAWTRDWEFEGLALAPDGRRAAVVIESGSRGDVWVKQLDRGPLSRLTFAGDYNAAPTWTPDGRFVTYVSLNQGSRAVRRVAADGSGGDSLLFELNRDIHYAETSRDGQWLVVSVAGGSDDVLALRVGQDTLPRPVLAESFDEFFPALSPDGRWLAYVSNESGREEVYLRPFPDTRAGKWQLTTDGGTQPLWSADGRELYFRSLDRSAVLSVGLGGGPGVATQRVVARLPASDDFEGNPRNRLFDVAADGRFLMIQRANATDVSGDLVVVLNWVTELVAKVRK